ncbi:hypothetical protein FOCC_FOCC013414 [Frankliniella occidentalis]|nr:hypothetical protein FOCC_FOCC013414 [Frankliniella occidentalis]
MAGTGFPGQRPCSNTHQSRSSQEYSSKNVGLTFAWVLGIIGPLLAILAFIAYKLFESRKRRRQRGEYSPPSQQKMMSRPQPVRLVQKEELPDDESSTGLAGGTAHTEQEVN